MCGIIGMLNKDGKRVDGSMIATGLSLMDERGNGQGAGYAAYGIYPDFKEYYALHVFLDNLKEAKVDVEQEIERWGYIVYSEEIPTSEKGTIEGEKIPYRYFFKPDPRKLLGREYNEQDAIVEMVMRINAKRSGAWASSRHLLGRRMSHDSTRSRSTRGICGLGTTGIPRTHQGGGVVPTPSVCSTGASCTMVRSRHMVRTSDTLRASGTNARC
jgi:glutamate synthase domain-containing protein 1